jgi:hypothetical protein
LVGPFAGDDHPTGMNPGSLYSNLIWLQVYKCIMPTNFDPFQKLRRTCARPMSFTGSTSAVLCALIYTLLWMCPSPCASHPPNLGVLWSALPMRSGQQYLCCCCCQSTVSLLVFVRRLLIEDLGSNYCAPGLWLYLLQSCTTLWMKTWQSCILI